MKILSKVFMVIIIVSSSSYAQQNALMNKFEENKVKDLQSVILNDINTGIKAVESPYYFSVDDWLTTGLVLGATSLVMTMDRSIRVGVQKQHSHTLDSFLPYAEYYGRGHLVLAGGGILYLTGLISGNEDITQTGRMLTQALVVTGVYTVGMKFLLGRSRPYENEGPYSVEGLQTKNEDNSLPSGHTSTAFAVSTVLSRKFDNIFASILLYGLAGATAYQRVYSDSHWFSDTMLGAAIGIFVGNKVYDLNNPSKQEENKLAVNPFYVSNGLGLSLSYTF